MCGSPNCNVESETIESSLEAPLDPYFRTPLQTKLLDSQAPGSHPHLPCASRPGGFASSGAVCCLIYIYIYLYNLYYYNSYSATATATTTTTQGFSGDAGSPRRGISASLYGSQYSGHHIDTLSGCCRPTSFWGDSSDWPLSHEAVWSKIICT